MPNDTTSQEAKANIEEIEDVDATSVGARGNIHSEKDELVEQDAPPPLPI